MAAKVASRSPLGALPRALAGAALAAALALPLLAWGLDRALGREVLLIAPHDARLVGLNRSLWLSGEPVAELYGSPMSASVRVLVNDEGALLHPPEDPSLTLLPIGDGRSHPFQVHTLWLLARLAAFGFAALGIAMLVLDVAARRRRRVRVAG